MQILQHEEHGTLVRLCDEGHENGKQSQGRARERHLSRLPPSLGQAHRTGDGRSYWGMSSSGRTGQGRRIKVRMETSCQPDSFCGQLAGAGMQRAWAWGGISWGFQEGLFSLRSISEFGTSRKNTCLSHIPTVC